MRCSCRALALSATLTAACTPSADTNSSSAADPSAWSTEGAAPRPTSSAPTVPTAPHRWELADRLNSLRKATPRARSQHLAGEHDAEVLANDEAAAYPALGPQRPLAAGAVLVEALYTAGSSDVALYFAMAKRASAQGGEWEYLVVRADGQVEQRGRLALCERCHTEAPDDHVFGRAR
ncbi:hypothetical protein [Polyangium sorediatum]|uniref:Cytochrome P460 domain-containing protein n=1 Tax=Polyangium sorediatum TaxID=889274 RepID=A0ABT6NVV6_9BACT|nr:hypothetical protein [Polyangium sorediatum]MDI1432424.1 hypothetical protein [Polyangium sorediatum]